MNSQIYDKKIPQGWGVTKLGDIVDFFDNLRIPVAASLRKFGTTPYYGANGIQDYVDGFTHNGEFVLIAEDGANDLINYPVNYVNGKIWVNNHAHVVSGKNKILDNKFLSYCLKLTHFSQFLVGGTRAKLNGKILKNIKILIPKDKAEQEMIAQVLGDMDDLISAKCELLDKKRAIKQAAAQQLLTPKPHWHTTTLGNVGEIITGSTPSTTNEKFWNGDIAWITPTDIGDKKDIFTGERSITQDGLKATRELPANSLLVTCIASIGKNAVLKVKGSCNQQINALIPNKNFNVDFLYYLLEFEKERLKNLAGITATLIISKALFSKFEILYPNFTEQTKIARVLSDIDDEILALQDEIEKLKMIKQGAMDELLSGKIRLKG